MMKQTALTVVLVVAGFAIGCAKPATFAECVADETRGAGTTSSDLRVVESLCRERFPSTAREIAAAEEVAAQREIFDRCIEGSIKAYEGQGVSMGAFADFERKCQEVAREQTRNGRP